MLFNLSFMRPCVSKHNVVLLLPLLLLTSRSLADTAVTLIGMCFFWHSYRTKSWQWLSAPWLKWVLIFFVYLVCINSVVSTHPHESILQSLFFLRWPLFASALAYWLLSTELVKTRFLQSLILICVSIMLDCIWQYFSGIDILGNPQFPDHRLSGPYHAPLPGIMLLRVFFIANFLLALLPSTKKHPNAFYWQWAMMFFCIVFLIMTGERMALMLYVAGMLIVWLCFLIEKPLKPKVYLSYFLLFVCMMFTFLWLEPLTLARVTTSIVEKLSHFWSSDYGLVFKTAFKIWETHPWLGSGLHTYRESCFALGLYSSDYPACTHPHNLYLLLGSETGIVGVCLYGVMVFKIYQAALSSLFKQKKYWMLGLSIAALTVCFFPLIGGISLWNNWVAALVWTTVGWTLAVNQSSLGQ